MYRGVVPVGYTNPSVRGTEGAMTDNVVGIAEHKDSRAIEMLEELLDIAKKGEIESFALVATTTDGGIVSAAGGKPNDPYTLIGGLEYVKNRVLSADELWPD